MEERTQLLKKEVQIKMDAPKINTALITRRLEANPALASKIEQMAIPLKALVSMTNGEPHPAFPHTLLNYWLLTSEQLDELAHFYHQRTPSYWTMRYPCPVYWDVKASIEEKRRRIGRFIGLRGCESPLREITEEDIRREVQEARYRDEEEEIFGWKRRGY